MKKTVTLTIIVGLFSLFALPALAMHHEVKIADKAGIGKHLTDTEGMTLYWFERDTMNHSACAGMCVGNWPLYFRQKVVAPAGTNADDFDTMTRDDGAKQTTFKGYPLYYFKGDAKPGDTNGQGMMDAWHVVNPEDFPGHQH